MSKVHVFDHPLIQHKLSILRDKNTSVKEFRELISEIAMLMCFEATRDLPLEEIDVETPVATAHCKHIAGKKLAIVPILRAGLGMVDGIMSLVPAAKVGHIGLYRDPNTLEPVEYYCKLPADAQEREILLVDPMLATGSSLVLAYNALCEKGGTPKYTHVAAVIASEQGIDYVSKNMPRQATTIWAAAVDEELTSRSYIVPGIGDAGDLAYGEKI
mgnify:CR=1 FL=1